MGSTVWTTNGSQLLVSYNQSTPQLFVVKGVCYQRPLIGERPENIDSLSLTSKERWKKDIDSMRYIGINTIKIYGLNLINDHTPFLDYAWNDGDQPIYVILSVWIENHEMLNQNYINDRKEDYKKLSKNYAGHPAVMGISIGSEINGKITLNDGTETILYDREQYWTNLNSIVNEVKNAQSAGFNKIITTGLIDDLGVSANTLNYGLKYNASVDVWGFDVYVSDNGNPYEGIYTNAEITFSASNKPKTPILITEFGEPACQPDTPAELNEADINTLKNRLKWYWDTIQDNTNQSKDDQKLGCGGIIFSWVDEWWKQKKTETDNPCRDMNCNEYTHDLGTKSNPGFVSKYWHEEWFGLNRLNEQDGGATLIPRASYELFRGMWSLSIWAGIYKTAVHWGPETNEWYSNYDLEITPDGQVKFNGKPLKRVHYWNNMLSWDWEDNDSFAQITFTPQAQVNSFWSKPPVGATFTGIFNDDPKSGLVGIRGYIPKITLYEHENYNGSSKIVTDSLRDLTVDGFNDKISSCKVDAGIWALYEDGYFQGRFSIIPPGEYPNAAKMGITNDTLTSLQPLGDHVIWLFEHENYGGSSKIVTGSISDLNVHGFNDKVSSCKVISGRWLLYEDGNFQGRISILAPGEYPNAAKMGITNDTLSSLRPKE